MTGGTAPDGAASSPGARAQVLDIVSDVQGWRMSPDRWRAVDELLAEMEQAMADSADDDLAAAAAELELMGPVRLIRIGSIPVPLPPPPGVQERVDRLVHSLGGFVVPDSDR